MVIKSRYTSLIDIEDGSIIYNTKNGGQVFIRKSDKNYNIIEFLKNNRCDKIENELIRKVFCVDDDVDEIKIVLANFYKNMFDPTILSFIIMPNNICNFSCKYCYQYHDKKNISENTINNFISAIKNYYYDVGLKYFYIEWFGGEPMMSFNVIKKVTLELNSFFNEKNIKYHYGITTNGSLLTKHVVDFLLENNFDFFQITIDGGKTTHNENRPFLNGNGSFDVIMDNLLYFKTKIDKHFHIAIRVNYNLETSETIYELLDEIKSNFDDRWSVFFHPIGKWGGNNDENLEVVTGSISNAVLEAFMDEAVERGIEPRINYNHMNPFGMICYAGLPYFFTLGTDGFLRKCNEEDEKLDYINIVGTINQGKIELYMDKWSKFVLPNCSEIISQKCLNCRFFPICFGLNCPKEKLTHKNYECPNTLQIYEEMLINKYKYLKSKKCESKKSKSL